MSYIQHSTLLKTLFCSSTLLTLLINSTTIRSRNPIHNSMQIMQSFMLLTIAAQPKKKNTYEPAKTDTETQFTALNNKPEDDLYQINPTLKETMRSQGHNKVVFSSPIKTKVKQFQSHSMTFDFRKLKLSYWSRKG
jgi:hypothetical protein